MLPLLLLAFIVVPIVELAVIVEIGMWLGLPVTIALLLLDSVLGALLVKREGRRAWRAFRSALDEGRWPGDEVVQGALVLVGGALLVTPGFVTDVLGLLAVLPPSRALASRFLRRRLTPAPLRLAVKLEGRGTASRGRPRSSRRSPRVQVPDVEVVSVERREEPKPRTGDEAAG